jgi:hypothetical protein
MADPVVTITNGVPTTGTGTITTLGQTLVDGANATHGITTGAAVTTDAAGTFQQYLRGLVKLFTAITVKAASTAPVATDPALVVAISPNTQNANGTTTDANSTPVAWSTEGKAQVGSLTETAPASDTASSGLNGRLQRIAQNITTMIAATLKVALQAATSGGLSRSRTLIPNNTTAIVVKSGAGQLYKVRATNNSATIAYIKIYDATSATAGSGTPVDTIMIPASTSGAGVVDSTDIGTVHATGITYIVTTGIADADTTAPAASAYVVTFYYK